jgi:hypothetical protein
MASKLSLKFFEVSAARSMDIEQPFVHLAELILK